MPPAVESVYTLLNENGSVLGVAFRAPVLDATRPGTFMLTAGHSVAVEGQSSGSVRAVRSTTDEVYRAQVLVWPQDLNAPDIGLLYVPVNLGPPAELSSNTTEGQGVVRGSPSGVSTEQASFVGEILGEEWDSRDGIVVDVVLRDLGWLERPITGPSPLIGGSPANGLAYSSLRGLSGAPVFQQQGDGVRRVVAMIVRRNPEGLANHIYGLPSRTIAGLLADHGYQLRMNPSSATSQSPGPAIAMAGRLLRWMLEQPGGQHQLWDDVSELFYMGIPVDSVLRDVVRDPSRYHLDLDGIQQSNVEFVLARLLFKRGRSVEGRALLRKITRRAHTARSTEHVEISALAALRQILESKSSSPLKMRQEEFRRAADRYGSIGTAPDAERAYELASAYGREAALLPISKEGGADLGEVRSYFSWLAAFHRKLVEQYPTELVDKQEIVAISLDLISSMHGFNGVGGRDRSDLVTLQIQRGMTAAIQRENAVFAGQMCLASAALAHGRNDRRTAYRIASSAAGALRRNGINIDHEGIGPVLHFLDARDPPMATLVRFVFQYDVSDGLRFLASGGEVDSIGLDVGILRAAGAESAEWLSDTDGLLDIFGLELELQ